MSCAKKISIGSPHSLKCSDDLQNDAGLCYKKCKEGYYGVGPVCWAKNPTGWTGCGMGSAKSSSACGGIIFDQVASVGELALNVATMGSSGQATAARTNFAKLQKQAKEIKKVTDAISNARKPADTAAAANDLTEMLNADPNKLTDADIVRMAAELAALVDPTGVSGVIAAYSYPKCSQLK